MTRRARHSGQHPTRDLVRWLTRVKRRLGYYGARTWLWRGPFLRSLRPTDVFLVGHPKSGNTWVAYMLAILLRRDQDQSVTLVNVGRHVPFVHGRDHRIGRHSALPDPRIFRNEFPRYWQHYPKIVYLMRDPRAALVSLWHMYRTMFDDQQFSLRSFVDQYLSTTGVFLDWNRGLVRWDRQVTAALDEAAAGSRIMVVKYEELVQDRRASLERLAGFIGIDAHERDFVAAVERGAFGAMRQMEDRHGAEAYQGRAAGQDNFIRVGKIDGWQHEMGSEVAALIEREFGPVMRRVGYVA